jgi:hypothetical protein
MKMNDSVQAKLKEIVARYGVSVVDDPLRCQGLLNDLCPSSRKEVTSLILVLKEGVPWELLKAGKNAPRQAVHTRLVRQVMGNIGLSEDVARWAVQSWAIAVETLPPTVQARHMAPAAPQTNPQNPIKPIKPTRTAAALRARASLTLAGKPPKAPGVSPKLLLDIIQRPIVLGSFAVSVVAVLYLLILSEDYGGTLPSALVLIVSGATGVASFLFLSLRRKAAGAPAGPAPKTPPATPSPKATP